MPTYTGNKTAELFSIPCENMILQNHSKFKPEICKYNIFVNYAHFYVNAIMLTQVTDYFDPSRR